VHRRGPAHNTAYLTLVALDDLGRPAPVAPAVAQTPTEQRRMREAELRRANRLTERTQIKASREREAQSVVSTRPDAGP
jgi:acyl-CoA hydrolase